jgi:hypothetical protein
MRVIAFAGERARAGPSLDRASVVAKTIHIHIKSVDEVH